MNAEREYLDPVRRSILARTSWESVIEVFSFIPLTYYHEKVLSLSFHLRRGDRRNLVSLLLAPHID